MNYERNDINYLFWVKSTKSTLTWSWTQSCHRMNAMACKWTIVHIILWYCKDRQIYACYKTTSMSIHIDKFNSIIGNIGNSILMISRKDRISFPFVCYTHKTFRSYCLDKHYIRAYANETQTTTTKTHSE